MTKYLERTLRDLSYMFDTELQKLKTDVTRLGLQVLLVEQATSDLDAMEVNFLSERAVCTLGANNFFYLPR